MLRIKNTNSKKRKKDGLGDEKSSVLTKIFFRYLLLCVQNANYERI